MDLSTNSFQDLAPSPIELTSIGYVRGMKYEPKNNILVRLSPEGIFVCDVETGGELQKYVVQDGDIDSYFASTKYDYYWYLGCHENLIVGSCDSGIIRVSTAFSIK